LVLRELFESINCEELLKGRFMQPDESPSFAAMVKRFNMVRHSRLFVFDGALFVRSPRSFRPLALQTGQWVCCTLLKYETAVERTKAIEQCIKICAVHHT
jgi:hypothetical protein